MTFSQYGEDRVLQHLLPGSTGCFVDVGAHHSRRLSNTYALYRRGWSGVAIDPSEAAARSFARDRPRDRFVQQAVGSVDSEATFYRFEESAFDTLDVEVKEQRTKAGHLLVGESKVSVRRLDTILDAVLPQGTRIDLMSIDVEGRDADVIRSNDWDRWRPSIVCVEALEGAERAVEHAILAVGYVELARTIHSAFFTAVTR
jgi:FkbM family methyltransferase